MSTKCMVAGLMFLALVVAVRPATTKFAADSQTLEIGGLKQPVEILKDRRKVESVSEKIFKLEPSRSIRR